MFMLTLPVDVEGCPPQDGECRINGKKAEYHLGYEVIQFRYVGEEWQERGIVDVSENIDGNLITLICDDGDGKGVDIIRPAV